MYVSGVVFDVNKGVFRIRIYIRSIGSGKLLFPGNTLFRANDAVVLKDGVVSSSFVKETDSFFRSQ